MPDDFNADAINMMHAVITVPDAPQFRTVEVTHHVRLTPTGAYTRGQADQYNAVLLTATLADGTQLAIWPDGTVSVTNDGARESHNYRFNGDAITDLGIVS